MNCVMQLDLDKIAPTAPKNVKLVKATNTLKWQVSTDNKRVLGYSIYSNGKRIGFTPLNYFAVGKSSKLSVRAVDLAGNESGLGN
jgi:mannobiose 2-epimerase